MAVQVHVARVGFLKVDGAGNVIDKESPTTTIKEHLNGAHEHRVIPNVTHIPNTANSPTIKTYLELEAADDFVLEYMDQNTVITYERTSGGGFA